MTVPHEGTHSRYGRGCRCNACRLAHNVYLREHGYNTRQGKRGEYKRKWDEEHRAVCACGALCADRTNTRCLDCHQRHIYEQRHARRERIAALWGDGMTLREIAAALNSTVNSIGTEMVTMRQEGWDLPYRQGYPRPSRV